MGIEQEISRTKRLAKWGCLGWAVLLIIGPILLIVGYFYYHTEFKERTLVISQSPNNTNTIEIVEKGEPAFFGPSSVRIKYRNQHIDRAIGNDGKMLNESNASVEWKSEDNAIITLFGEEQHPETIEFNKDKPEVFNSVQVELDSTPLTKSDSPDQTYIIEIRELLMSQGEKPERSIRIYYGENGSTLNNYKEYDHLNRSYTADQLFVEWANNTLASIRISADNEVEDVVEIDFSE